MSNKKHGIYIELDCILDTRLATLCQVDESLVDAAFANNYFKRQEDSFPKIKKETFKTLYDNRDSETLKFAYQTSCVELVNIIINTVLKNCVDQPLATGCKLFVNIYPYKLTDIEINTLLALMIEQTRDLVDIEIINMSPDSLTTSYCRDKIDCMFMYDYNAWLDAQCKNKNILKAVIRHIKVYGPRIYFNKIPSDSELKSMEKDGLTPFKAVEDMASVLVDLDLIDISMFCVDVSKFVKTGKKT